MISGPCSRLLSFRPATSLSTLRSGRYRTPRSGRIEARTGLRMMPTFPRSPLSFRTAGFPQYGWKAGLSGRTFPCANQLKPTPGIRRPTSGLSSPFVHLVASSLAPLCVGPVGSIAHRHAVDPLPTPEILAPVRVVVSRSINTYSTSSAPLTGASQFRRTAAYMRCLRCAGAPSRPASGSGLSLTFLPNMPSSTTPESSNIHEFQRRDVDIGLH